MYALIRAQNEYTEIRNHENAVVANPSTHVVLNKLFKSSSFNSQYSAYSYYMQLIAGHFLFKYQKIVTMVIVY